MARTDPQVNIRMPQELKTRLEEAAKQSGRSLNSDIIARLDQSFGGPPEGNVLLALQRVQLSYADKERLLAQQSKTTRLFFDMFVKKFETAVAALEGSRKLTKAEIRELTLDLHNAKEVRRMLEKNEGLDHIAEDDEDDQDDDYQQDEPGLPVRNRP